MHPEYQKHNSKRGLTWRFDRITELLERRPTPAAPNPRVDDQYVCIGRRFLGRLLAEQDEEKRQELFPKNPGLYYAYERYQDPDQEQAILIQTGLLAGLTDEEIADRTAEMPATIDWYEALFYNVRDRLGAKHWIVRNCLGPAAQRYTDDHGRQFTLKLFSYFCGGDVLDLMLSGFDPTKNWRNYKDLNNLLDDLGGSTIRRRATASLMTAEITRHNIMELTACHVRLMELAQAAKTADEGRTIIETNIETMLGMLTWDVGKPKASALGDPLRQLYHNNMNAELRADEMLAIGVGKKVLIPDEIVQLRIPEPRTADANAQQGS